MSEIVVCGKNFSDTQHVASNGRTLCGRDAREWRDMSDTGVTPKSAMSSAYSCERCQQIYLSRLTP